LGLAPLYLAASNDNIPIVRLLMNHAAAADLKNERGVTLLEIMSNCGYDSIVHELLGRHSPSESSSSIWQAINRALIAMGENNNSAIARVLIDRPQSRC